MSQIIVNNILILYIILASQYSYQETRKGKFFVCPSPYLSVLPCAAYCYVLLLVIQGGSDRVWGHWGHWGQAIRFLYGGEYWTKLTIDCVR